MGKNILRIIKVSLVLIFLLIMQIMPPGEIIIHNASSDSNGAKPTEVGIFSDTLDYSSTDMDEQIQEMNTQLAFDLLETSLGHFTENLGQWKSHISFLAKSSFGYFALGPDGVFYYMIQEGGGHVIKIAFQDAGELYPIGREDVGFDCNYFYRNDPTKWVRNARSYKEVLYKDVWPGIDILYYFTDGNLKYDLIVGEYSDPDVISFCIEGHFGLDIEDNGLKIFISDKIVMSDTNLVAFYKNGATVPIQFKKISENTYGFEVKKAKERTLIIDPVIFSTSTFLGGSGGDGALDIAIDDNNNIIILGVTGSNDFPNTTGAYQTDGGSFIVTKMNQDASALIFSTYIGAWMGDIPYGLEVDDSNDVYVAGQTWSQNFPTTPGVFQESDPSGTYPDVFVLKLNALGSDLIYSTYVGGTQSDYAYDIKVRNGNAYVVGSTLSYDFPHVGSPGGDPHGTVLFFILNSDASNLTSSAFWGGWSNEFGYSLAIDGNGDVVVGGVTFSQDFPTTPNAYQTAVSDTNNAFLLKYQPLSDSLIFSTYIGGDTWESIRSVYIDDSTEIYLAGNTGNPGEGATPYPTTPGAFDRTINGGRDIFISKMDSKGADLIYSTFIGGDGDEETGRIDVDSQGNVFLTGTIDSAINFTVTSDCFDNSYNGEDDAFVLILNNNGSDLKYSSFLGGNSSDSGSACLITETNDILILGATTSYDFPVTNGSYQTENKGNSDIFLTIFSDRISMFLQEGWNLISVPLIQSDTDLESVLSSISGYYDAVQWYDAYSDSISSDPNLWKHNHDSKPSHMNNLKDLNHIRGFWIHITEPNGVFFKCSGIPPKSNQYINLHQGWNLVGYPSLSPKNRTEALYKLQFGTHVDSIWTYNAGIQEWKELGPSDYFEVGRGYWIHAKVGTFWEVPL
ncbi:MAG: SBBP repeat-containing protein [Thermoplasmata archaeon]|nr:MAG: SBBP repeat-containing protein [Thermoplasmata archaeon]